MKRLWLLVFIFVFSVPAFPEQNYGSLMYQITSPDMQDTSFIFGTMHLVPKDEFFIWDIVTDKIQACDKIAIETDVSMGQEQQMKLMEQILLPDNQSLYNFIDSAELNQFKTYIFENVDIPQNMMEYIMHIQPFFAISIITSLYLVDPASYDMHFAETAKKSNKELVFLESVDFQMNMIDSIPVKDQFELFANTKIFEEYDELYAAYSKMDLFKIDKLMKEDKSYKNIEEWMVHKRNFNWMKTIVPLINTNSAFIAVGAGHLLGDKGLLSLLKLQGYQVTAVPLAVNDI